MPDGSQHFGFPPPLPPPRAACFRLTVHKSPSGTSCPSPAPQRGDQWSPQIWAALVERQMERGLSLPGQGRLCLSGHGGQDMLPTGTCRGGTPTPHAPPGPHIPYSSTLKEWVFPSTSMMYVPRAGSAASGRDRSAMPCRGLTSRHCAMRFPLGSCMQGHTCQHPPASPAPRDETARGSSLLLSRPRCLPKPPSPRSLPHLSY